MEEYTYKGEEDMVEDIHKRMARMKTSTRRTTGHNKEYKSNERDRTRARRNVKSHRS